MLGRGFRQAGGRACEGGVDFTRNFPGFVVHCGDVAGGIVDWEREN